MLSKPFFNRDAVQVAQQLLGKVIYARHQTQWLNARIIETEAYYCHDKASHASLGYTEKRKALFMPPGTIYMYYARGGDSLNISCRGKGNAVLIKAGIADQNDAENIAIMQQLNPNKNRPELRDPRRLCSGQTLLCQSLGLKVKDWDQQNFARQRFFIADMGHVTDKIIQTTRLGIPEGRDSHLFYRFIDYNDADSATQNPLRKRDWRVNHEYQLIEIT